jgi:hypothetical protein
MKPGYKTTEFWLKVAAFALTAVYASGALTNSTALAIAGIAATLLGSLGYTVSRTLVKQGPKIEAGKLLETTTEA